MPTPRARATGRRSADSRAPEAEPSYPRRRSCSDALPLVSATNRGHHHRFVVVTPVRMRTCATDTLGARPAPALLGESGKSLRKAARRCRKRTSTVITAAWEADRVRIRSRTDPHPRTHHADPRNHADPGHPSSSPQRSCNRFRRSEPCERPAVMELGLELGLGGSMGAGSACTRPRRCRRWSSRRLTSWSEQPANDTQCLQEYDSIETIGSILDAESRCLCPYNMRHPPLHTNCQHFSPIMLS